MKSNTISICRSNKFFQKLLKVIDKNKQSFSVSRYFIVCLFRLVNNLYLDFKSNDFFLSFQFRGLDLSEYWTTYM